MARTRVLAVDDSELFLESVLEFIDGHDDLELAGVAMDGKQAVQLTVGRRPDVIIMDLHMPGMNGLTAIEEIMADHPTPILVVTGDPEGEVGRMALEALRRGALEVMVKPTCSLSVDSEEGRSLAARLQMLAGIQTVARRRRAASYSPPARATSRSSPSPPRADSSIVAIVASTGGPVALKDILNRLPGNLGCGILVVQHLAAGFVNELAVWLDEECAVSVRVAKSGDTVPPGAVLLAPDSTHLVLERDRRVRLSRDEPEGGHRPSGDVLLRTVARACGSRCLGVVLTGMGDDGSRGLLEIRRAGGITIAQEPSTCVVEGMPRRAMDLGAVTRTLTLDEIANVICDIGGVLSCENRRISTTTGG